MLASVTPTNSAHLPTQYDHKPMTEATLQLCFPHRQASKVSPYSMFSIKMTDRPDSNNVENWVHCSAVHTF